MGLEEKAKKYLEIGTAAGCTANGQTSAGELRITGVSLTPEGVRADLVVKESRFLEKNGHKWPIRSGNEPDEVENCLHCGVSYTGTGPIMSDPCMPNLTIRSAPTTSNNIYSDLNYVGPAIMGYAVPFPETAVTSGTEWTWIDSRTGDPLSTEQADDEEDTNYIEDLLIKVFRWISGLGNCPPELDKLLAEFKDDINSSHQGTRQKALGKAVAQTLLWVLGELDEDEQK